MPAQAMSSLQSEVSLVPKLQSKTDKQASWEVTLTLCFMHCIAQQRENNTAREVIANNGSSSQGLKPSLIEHSVG